MSKKESENERYIRMKKIEMEATIERRKNIDNDDNFIKKAKNNKKFIMNSITENKNKNLDLSIYNETDYI